VAFAAEHEYEVAFDGLTVLIILLLDLQENIHSPLMNDIDHTHKIFLISRRRRKEYK
jgi:hypothetical protein